MVFIGNRCVYHVFDFFRACPDKCPCMQGQMSAIAGQLGFAYILYNKVWFRSRAYLAFGIAEKYVL